MNELQHIMLTSEVPWDPSVLNDEDKSVIIEDDDCVGDIVRNDDTFNFGELIQGLNLGDVDYEHTLVWLEAKCDTFTSQSTKEVEMEKTLRGSGFLPTKRHPDLWINICITH